MSSHGLKSVEVEKDLGIMITSVRSSVNMRTGIFVGYGDATHSFRANINNLLRYLNVRNI